MFTFSPAFSALTIPDESNILLTLATAEGKTGVSLNPPILSLNGETVPLLLGTPEGKGTAEEIFDGVQEYRIRRQVVNLPYLTLETVLRITPKSPVVRFQFCLHSGKSVALTRPDNRDALTYFEAQFLDSLYFKEIRFSEFNPLFHSFLPTETTLPDTQNIQGIPLMGPLLFCSGSDYSALVAYEHGSQVPDAFLAFEYQEAPLMHEGQTQDRVVLRAIKGNYYDGQVIEPGKPFSSLWFQVAVADLAEYQLAHCYRDWVLTHQTPNVESRKPYIFYNTWNYQERVKHWEKRSYLADMNETRMLAEIEVAHRMGIDVFVIDTGWYEKTGDWRVSTTRFPNGLATIKAKLDEYGMKLGLWFNPTVAAVSSEMRKNHEDCLMMQNGKPQNPHEVWETEASQGLCLVSRYWEAFADELIRLNHEVGVTYYKWDAIGQYGCDAPGHFHGTETNTSEERREGYGFLLGTYMTKVIDKLCAACPEAIVDFDITEGGRTVGLQFLSAGKYFLINNGPYNHNYNMPVPADGNVNLFFFPGPARAWICRSPLTYDDWIPSVLFLTHYLPDDAHKEWWAKPGELDGENPWIAIASLFLGQNGIWGDLCSLSDENIARFGHALALYKQVRDDVTAAYPHRTGSVGGSPEIHEKINRRTGKGVVSIFSSTPGTYTYVTESPVAPTFAYNHGITVRRNDAGQGHITAKFQRGEYAKVIFFGTDEKALM